MGGIVSAPQPVVQVASAPAEPVEVDEVVNDDQGAARRGRAGTIQTSERGLIQVKPQLAKKKTLLGE